MEKPANAGFFLWGMAWFLVLKDAGRVGSDGSDRSGENGRDVYTTGRGRHLPQWDLGSAER